MDRGGFTIGRLLLLSYIKDYDAVPVVDVVGLYIRAFGLDSETVGIDTVFIYESIIDGLCATLGETHVVIACAGVLICVTDDGDILFGIGLHPFGDIVYVYHFGIGDLRRVEREAYGSHQRSGFDNCGLGFNDFGARELSFCSGESGGGSGKSAAKVVDLTVKIIDISEIIAGVVRLIVATTEGDGETAGCSHIDVDRSAKGDIVEVVAIHRCAGFSKEIDIFAKTETELEATRYGESPCAVLRCTVLAEDRPGRFLIPYIGTAESDEGYDREYTLGINTTERVEHISHEVDIGTYIFRLIHHILVDPVKRATVECKTPAHIRREPFAEAEVVVDGDVAFAIAM